MKAKYFDVKPLHWYEWINPFWWRRRRTIQAVLDYQWEKYGKDKFEKAYRDAMIYGKGIADIDFEKD